MALTESSLSTKLQTELDNLLTIVDSTQLQKFCDAIAKAVVDEVTTNAVVPAGIAVQVSTDTGTGATTAPGAVT